MSRTCKNCARCSIAMYGEGGDMYAEGCPRRGHESDGYPTPVKCPQWAEIPPGRYKQALIDIGRLITAKPPPSAVVIVGEAYKIIARELDLDEGAEYWLWGE